MNSKTLKAMGVVIFSCLVMIVIVIYTPKPTSTPNRSKKTLEERLERFNQEGAYIDLVIKVLRKANEAAMRVNTAVDPSGKEIRFNNKEEPYLEKRQLNPLIERNTEIIVGLAEAGIAIRNVTRDFKVPAKRTQFKDLIKANTELLTALNAVSEAMNALNKMLQRFTEENAHLHLSPADAVYDVLVTVSKAQHSVTNAMQVKHTLNINALKSSMVNDN